MSFNAITFNVFFFINHCHGFTFAIKICCLKTCLSGVNLRQITLLIGYIHPNGQPVVFIPYMLCLFAAH